MIADSAGAAFFVSFYENMPVRITAMMPFKIPLVICYDNAGPAKIFDKVGDGTGTLDLFKGGLGIGEFFFGQR